MKPLTLGLWLSLLGTALAQAADEAPRAVGGKTYASHLASAALLGHPEVRAVAIRVGGAGSRSTPIGVSPPGVAPTGVATHAVLRNVSGDALGTIEITLTPDAKNGAAVAKAISDYIAKRTLSAKNLADPWPYDPHRSSATYAQTLVDQAMRSYPELLVFAIHATPPGEKTNIIIASNIGRIGKAADDDDLRVIEKGETNLEVAEGGERFEVELPLNDAKGARIGALGAVFRYKAGDDKKALQARAIAIRDALARQTPSSAALFRIHG